MTAKFNVYESPTIIPEPSNTKARTGPLRSDHVHNCGFIFAASTFDYSLALVIVHIVGESADEAFIYFNFARQLARIFRLRRKPKPVEHKPRGFLSDFDCTVNPPKDSSCIDGELSPVVAIVALPTIVPFLKGYVLAFTTSAFGHAIWPAAGHNALAAIDGSEELNSQRTSIQD